MAIVVHISEGCRKQARSHGWLPAVERLAAEIESKQHTGNLEKHLPYPIVEKVMGRSYRLYGVEKNFGEHKVICFSEFFAKGANETFHRDIASPSEAAAFMSRS